MSAPVDNLVRAWASPEATVLRNGDGGDADTMLGHFAVFDRWTQINSQFEGRFMERIAPSAFDATFKARGDQVRVLYDHGADPMIGNKPLGTPRVMRSDKTGAYYEVDLFDASYVNDLKPAIRAGQLGASFRFKVTDEQWSSPSEPTDHNPEMLDERTVTGVDLYEFGPVTFPAYPDASAGMRSRTDEFLEHFLNDPQFIARFKERVGPAVVEQIRASLPPTAETLADDTEPPTEDRDDTPETPTDGGAPDDLYQRRLALHARRVAGFVAHLERKESIP